MHDNGRKENPVIALQITSIEKHAGKNLLAMRLTNRLMGDGLKAGHFKPIGHFPAKVGKQDY
jgi:hypothetical protein